MDQFRLITPNADDVNAAYLDSLVQSSGVVFQRLQRFVAPLHQQQIRALREAGETRPAIKALDCLSDVFLEAYPAVKADIDATATSEQSARQAVKSNAGKIFERYVGYALATALTGTGWAVWHNRQDAKDWLGLDPADYLSITKVFEDEEIPVDIEGDLLITRPGDEDSPLMVVSIKSTLKDRLHNVTMWQLAKDIALDPHLSKKLSLTAKNPEKLARVIYCLACADTAQEQPDLAAEPRRKIKFDVSFLNYAFAAVASNEASYLASIVSEKGRGSDLFHRMSAIGDILAYIDKEREAGKSPTAAEVEERV